MNLTYYEYNVFCSMINIAICHYITLGILSPEFKDEQLHLIISNGTYMQWKFNKFIT